MPSTVPSIDGLAPLWNFAISIGANPNEFIAALKSDGVQVLELSISGKKAYFADKAELEQYVARNAAPTGGGIAIAPVIQDRLDEQYRQIQALRRQLAELQAAGGRA
jgi:hypothetical protein